MSDLKPCPFCGSEAALAYNKKEVVCLKCEALGPFCDTEAEVIAAWNSRAERTCQRFWTGAEMICSSCAQQLNDATANYCPNCGCKVVEE